MSGGGDYSSYDALYNKFVQVSKEKEELQNELKRWQDRSSLKQLANSAIKGGEDSNKLKSQQGY